MVLGWRLDQVLGEIIGTNSVNRDWYQCRSESSSSATDQSSSGTGESQEGQSTTSTNPVTSGSGSGTEGTVVTKSVEPTKVTLDIEKNQSTSEFGYSKSDKINTFRVKDGHVFSKVTKGSTDIWDSKGGECGTKVIFIDENKKYVSILLQNGGFVFYILSDDDSWRDTTSTKHDIDRLKFYGEGDAPLSQNDYDVTIVDYSYRFTFNAGVNCKKIKFSDDELWKPSDDPEYAEITAFDLGLISNNFFVKKGSKFKKIDFNPTQAKGGPTTTPVSEVVTATTVPQTSLTILTEDAPEKASVTIMSPTGRPRPKKTSEVATGHRTAITLDIGEKASNSAIDFKEDYQKNVMVFSAMEKYVFNKIVKTGGSKCCGSKCCESETVIWEAKDQTEHFHRVYVDGLGTFSKTKNMSLHLCNGNFIHLNGSDSGPWSESPAVVDLDVRISNSNIQVDYFQKDNYRIYVAKPGYTIRKVMKSKKCSSDCICSPKVIWEAQSEHALKVVLMGSKKEPKHLAVLLESGGLTLLYKGGKGEPWEDVTSSKNKITDLKMYAMGDDKESVELHRGHYSITLFNEFYGYLFYDGVGCVKVTHNDKTIWNLKEERDFGCLKGVFLDLKSNKFNVMNDDDRYWVCEQVRKVNPVPLDISSKASTDDFDFTVDHNRNIKVYTSKGNAMFNQVIKKSSTNCCGSTCCDSEIVIWETEDPKKFASKVFADGVGACSSTKNVSIYLLNGDILHFGEGDDGWKKSGNKIILDVDKTSSTIGYDFVHEGETRTFTPKPGYLFSRVLLGGSVEHTFWKSQIDNQCSNKVTVYGVETSVTNINIFLKNNQIKHFHKVDDKWVSETSIVLDIESNKDNDLFEYRSTRNFGHFNPKANLTIKKIVKTTSDGSVKIWTAEPKDQGLKAVLMGSGKDEKHLSILLQSGNFVLLRKCGKGQCWEDITKDKSDFSNIKIYSLEEGTSNYHELTGKDYDPIVFESRYGYEFKEGVKCVKITYNDKLLWSHTDDPEFGYLKGIYLDLPKDQFIVTNLKDQTKELTKAKVAKVTLDINKTESTNDFEHSESHDFHKYTAKFCRVFSKVVQGTTDIWDSGDDVFATSVGFTSKDDQNYVVVLLDNGNFVLFRLDAGNWTDITSSKFDVKMLEFYGKNDNELSSSNYTVELRGHRSCFTISYLFDRGPKCKTVMYGNDIVYDKNMFSCYKTINRFDFDPVSNIFYAVKNCCDWRTIDYKPTSETATVTTTVSVTKPAVTTVSLDIEKTESTDEFDFTEQNGVVTYTPKSDHVFNKVFEGTKDIWESKTDVCGTLVRTKVSKNIKYLVVLMTNNMFTLFNLDDDEWKDITSDRHDVNKLKFLGEGDAEITTSDYTVSIVDLSFTYIFKDGVSCKKVKLEDDDVWKHTDDSNFADLKSFSLGLASNSFFVKNQSDEVKKIEKKAEAPVTKPEETAPETKPEEEPETPPETEEPTPEPPVTETTPTIPATPETTPTIPATPETTPETKTPQEAPETKPETTPAEPTVTKFVLDIEKTQSTSEFDYKLESGIVTYTVKSGYGFTKVTQGTIVIWESTDLYGTLVRTKLFSNNERFLAIIFYNNTFKLFRQSDGDTTWEDVTDKRRDVTKLKFLSHNDHVLTNVDFAVSLVDFFYTYKFNDGVSCKKITYNNNMLWTHTDDPKFAEIKSLSLDLPTNKFIVTNLKDQTKELTKPDITIDSLDINTSQTTTEFEWSKSSDFHKYNPKTEYVFSKVAYENTVIWESKDNLYGTEVMFIEGVKYLVVLLQNNMFKLFEHHNDKWHDTTSKRHDVTKLKFFGENNVELTKSDYNASFVDFFYRLKFNTNVKCRKITYNNIELWKHTDDPKFSEIMLFSLGLASNSFFVKSMSGRCKKLPETAVPTQQPAPTEKSTEAEETKQQSAESEDSAQPAEPNQSAEPNSSEQSTPTSSASSS